MVYRVILVSSTITVFLASLLAHRRLEDPLRPEVSPGWQCRRIVSLAPSVTETLYALGLGDRVVAVTDDCDDLPELNGKARIGSSYAPNFEAVLALNPDLIIMLEDREQSFFEFEKLKLETLILSHKTVEGIIGSFRVIGRMCGKGPEGRALAYEYENRLGRIHEKTRLLPRPRTLIALDRVFGRGSLADVYLAGADAYSDRLIELAGGRNAYEEHRVRYPVVSREGILRLNPAAIVDLVPKKVLERYSRQTVLDDWNDVAAVEAVKNQRVLVFDQDYARVRGPRFIQLVEGLARTLHPDVKWDKPDEFEPPYEENEELGTKN
jgi:iron complex transport system substrate-binding protein